MSRREMLSRCTGPFSRSDDGTPMDKYALMFLAEEPAVEGGAEAAG